MHLRSVVWFAVPWLVCACEDAGSIGTTSSGGGGTGGGTGDGTGDGGGGGTGGTSSPGQAPGMCSVAVAAPSAGAPWLLALVLPLALRRRRRA